jgi:hypothetical protein
MRMATNWKTGAAALTLALFAAPAAAELAAAPRLASHKALYDLKLAEGVGSKAPASASGKIAFDFSSACEGYSQTLRQAVDIQPQEGEPRFTLTRSTTFEDAAGVDFRFKTDAGAGPEENVDGRAERDARGALAVALSRPKPFRFNVEDGALLPTQHLARVIEAARRGDRIFEARVYDASDDGRKVNRVTAIIGPPLQTQDKDQAALTPALNGLQRWPVSLAYFSEGKRDPTPDYVLSYHLYENGVATQLRLDYGDFVLVGELTRIDFPPPSRCRR